MNILKNPQIDFLRWRWHALSLSLVLIVTGVATIATKGLALGVEFAGGTIVIAKFEEQPSVQQIRSALGSTFGGQSVIVQQYGDPDLREVMIRVPEVGAESGTSLSATAEAMVSAMNTADLGAFEVIGTEIVGPAVGAELRSKGTWATVLSLTGILLYITFRYQLSFAVGTVAATVHDLLIVFAFLAFFQYDVSLNVIAGILTVAGYSTNDTIVIFDRVRENLRRMRRDNLNQVINVSINQTLGRTIITSGTTLMSALALFLVGGEVLRGFAFTLLVGVITGTFSSVFVAAAVVSLWRGRGPARATAQAPSTAATSQQQPPQKSKPQRKARAS